MLHEVISYTNPEFCTPWAGNNISGIRACIAQELLLSSSGYRYIVLWCLDEGLCKLTLCIFHLESISAKVNLSVTIFLWHNIFLLFISLHFYFLHFFSCLLIFVNKFWKFFVSFDTSTFNIIWLYWKLTQLLFLLTVLLTLYMFYVIPSIKKKYVYKYILQL